MTRGDIDRPIENWLTALAIIVVFLVAMLGCAPEDAPVANSGTCADMGILVVAAQACDGWPSPAVVSCQADGSVPGGPAAPYPVGGCTITLKAELGQPSYAATCVEACDGPLAARDLMAPDGRPGH